MSERRYVQCPAYLDMVTDIFRCDKNKEIPSHRLHRWEQQGISITWIDSAPGAVWPIDSEGFDIPHLMPGGAT